MPLRSKGLMAFIAPLALVAALIVPSMASAAEPAEWNFEGPVKTQGVLTFEAVGLTITCDVEDEGETLAGGKDKITSFTILVSTCETNLQEGCVVTAASTDTTPPWESVATKEGGEFFDEITGIDFSNTLAGTMCPLAQIHVTGHAKGTYDNATGTLTFNKAEGLTVNGEIPATLSGFDKIISPEGVELE